MITTPSKLQTFGEYRKMTDVDQIGRRKFVNNAFDGVLTMVGVVMGSYLAGVSDPRVVLSTGFATSMAMGVSGFWGAYITEEAERTRELDELERAMLSDLTKTKQARASRFATVIIAAVDGLSPFLAGFFVVLPFLFPSVLGMTYSYYAAIALSLILLFALGAFTGKVARKNLYGSGARMLVAGIVCIVLSFLLKIK